MFVELRHFCCWAYFCLFVVMLIILDDAVDLDEVLIYPQFQVLRVNRLIELIVIL